MSKSKRKYKGDGFGDEKSKSRKINEWGKEKYNPKSVKKSEAATPWIEFKEKIIECEREMNRNYTDMGCKEAKQFLKKRNENYRRTLIESTRKEPTNWEGFVEEEDIKTCKSKQNLKFKKQIPYAKNNNGSNPNTELNFNQRNQMRRLLTKATITAKGGILNNAIGDMKRYGVFRNKPV